METDRVLRRIQRFLSGVHTCPRCGALVQNEEAHREFHEALRDIQRQGNEDINQLYWRLSRVDKRLLLVKKFAEDTETALGLVRDAIIALRQRTKSLEDRHIGQGH